jgi:hypothetical protein
MSAISHRIARSLSVAAASFRSAVVNHEDPLCYFASRGGRDRSSTVLAASGR